MHGGTDLLLAAVRATPLWTVVFAALLGLASLVRYAAAFCGMTGSARGDGPDAREADRAS